MRANRPRSAFISCCGMGGAPSPSSISIELVIGITELASEGFCRGGLCGSASDIASAAPAVPPVFLPFAFRFGEGVEEGILGGEGGGEVGALGGDLTSTMGAPLGPLDGDGGFFGGEEDPMSGDTGAATLGPDDDFGRLGGDMAARTLLSSSSIATASAAAASAAAMASATAALRAEALAAALAAASVAALMARLATALAVALAKSWVALSAAGPPRRDLLGDSAFSATTRVPGANATAKTSNVRSVPFLP